MVAVFSLVSILTAVAFASGADDKDESAMKPCEKVTTRFSKCKPDAGSVHKFMVETLDGKNTSMSRYAGNVLLIINVATYWRYTNQYKDYNILVNRYSNLRISAFPCNQFDLQEPGGNSEILNGLKHVRPGDGFVPDTNLHIYGKLEVNGKNAHPMFKFLKDACPPTGDILGSLKLYYWDEVRASDIVWNFEKFVVDPKGRPILRFHPGAWDNGTFVEKHLKEVLAWELNEISLLPSKAEVQSPSSSGIQSQNTSQSDEPKTLANDKTNIPLATEPTSKGPMSVSPSSFRPTSPATRPKPSRG